MDVSKLEITAEDHIDAVHLVETPVDHIMKGETA